MVKKFLFNFKRNIIALYIQKLIKSMPKKLGLTLTLMVFSSLFQGISLILLVPLLQLVGLNVNQGAIGQIAEIVSAFFAFIKLQPTLSTVLILYVITVTFIAVLYRFQTVMASDIQYQFTAKLRKDLYKSITNSNWLFFANKKSSNFAHALTNEIERISMGTGQFLTLLATIMVLFVYIFFALKIAGIITGIIFIVGVFILLILRRWVVKSKDSGKEITSTTQDLYSLITQHLDGMKTIKSYGIQEENIKIFNINADALSQNYLDAIKSYADVKFLFDVGTVIVLSIMVIFLIEFIKLPTASLFLLIYLFVLMIPQFSIIQRSYQYFLNSLPAFENVIELEKQCMDNFDQTNQDCQIIFKEVITLEDVSFSYDNDAHLHVNNLNVKIPLGKTIALLGHSGAGKSTIADLIMGFIQPSSGNIKVDNTSISNCIHSWRSQIGYVSQETFMFNKTIKFNLLLAMPQAKEQDIFRALKLAAAYDFVSKLPEGVNTIMGDRGIKLSAGERQRLALARALLKKPNLLILDEATSNLDSENEKKILNAIENLHGEITIIMIAHRLSTIRNADYIYLINNGQILESGTWNDLLKTEGRFTEICNDQNIRMD